MSGSKGMVWVGVVVVLAVRALNTTRARDINDDNIGIVRDVVSFGSRQICTRDCGSQFPRDPMVPVLISHPGIATTVIDLWRQAEGRVEGLGGNWTDINQST